MEDDHEECRNVDGAIYETLEAANRARERKAVTQGVRDLYDGRMDACKEIFPDDNDKMVGCMLNELYSVTQVQDGMNIRIFMEELEDHSRNDKWSPLQMIDNANAIILGISRVNAKPKYVASKGDYVEEKVGSLNDNWRNTRMKAGGVWL